MKRVLASIVGAAFGVSSCVAIVRVVTALGADVAYPAYAGEEDFTFRAAMLLLVEWPGFALLGGWLGNVALGEFRRSVLGAAGMIAGTVVTFLAQAAFIPVIEALPDSRSANAAVVVFLIGWLVLSVIGAVLGVRLARRPARAVRHPA